MHRNSYKTTRLSDKHFDSSQQHYYQQADCVYALPLRRQ
jgi:hypothetical protein